MFPGAAAALIVVQEAKEATPKGVIVDPKWKFLAIRTRKPGPIRKAKKVKKVKRPEPIFLEKLSIVLFSGHWNNIPTTNGEEESPRRYEEKAKRRLDDDDQSFVDPDQIARAENTNPSE